jgi:hypothetical protein
MYESLPHTLTNDERRRLLVYAMKHPNDNASLADDTRPVLSAVGARTASSRLQVKAEDPTGVVFLAQAKRRGRKRDMTSDEGKNVLAKWTTHISHDKRHTNHCTKRYDLQHIRLDIRFRPSHC